MSLIDLYTDASVKGDFLAKGRRRQRGPAIGGWIAWECGFIADTNVQPGFSGVAFLGPDHGPNSAEYAALILGLEAALNYVKRVQRQITGVYAYTDSDWILKQVEGRVRVGRLKRYYDRTRDLMHELEDVVGTVSISGVTLKGSKGLKRAHGLTKQPGWLAVLPESSWQPQRRWQPPPEPPAAKERRHPI